jgi:hypothetical protein
MRLSDSERVTPNLPDRSDLMAEDSAHEAQGSQPQGGEETAHSSKLGFAPVLKNRNFLALWSGQVFSQLADKVYLVLMIALIASRFQDTNQTISGWVSVLMIAFTIPAVLFGSVAGVFVDRWSKKAVLVSTNILRGILVLAVPTLLWITQGWKSFYDLPVGDNFFGFHTDTVFCPR